MYNLEILVLILQILKMLGLINMALLTASTLICYEPFLLPNPVATPEQLVQLELMA
jgi:hypothetical protein